MSTPLLTLLAGVALGVILGLGAAWVLVALAKPRLWQ